MEKSINSVRFVHVCEMTPEDWKILDWNDLRNKAKNRIAELIVAGALLGFYHVNVTDPYPIDDIEDEPPDLTDFYDRGGRKAKANYYYPAQAEDPEMSPANATFFRNEADDEYLNDEADDVDQTILENSLLPLEHLVRMLVALYVTGEKLGTECDKNRIRQLRKTLEDNGKLIDDDHFLTAIYIYRWWGKDEWEKVLEKIDREIESEQL